MARVSRLVTDLSVRLFGNNSRTLATILVSVLLLAALTVTVEQIWRAQVRSSVQYVASTPDPIRQEVFEQRPRVAFLGDSYAAGIGTDSASKAYVMLAADQLGWSARQFAVGGSGYSGPPNASYADRLDGVVEFNPTHVVVFGSRNDSEADPGVVREEAEQVLQRIRKELPEAELIIVGPIWTDNNPPADIVRVNEEVRSAADEAGAVFIDALDPSWLDGSPGLIDADGVHPSDAGHEHLAGKFLEELRKIGIV